MKKHVVFNPGSSFMKIASLLSVILLLFTLNAFAASNSLEDLLSQAVITLMDGDEQAERGNTPAARALYEQALGILHRIQDQDPAFNTNIIEFRIENIEEKISGLTPETEAESPASSTEPDAQDTHDLERRFLDAKEKALADSQRLLEVERRNLDLQMALRERERVLTQQRDQLQENQREITRLQRAKEQLTQETNREVQDLRRFNNLLQDRSNALETENERILETLAHLRERDAERGVRVESLRNDLLEIEQTLERERETAEAENTQLRDRLSACAAESRGRFEQLDQAQQTIEALQQQVAGVPLLEDTVIELNRRLNQQTLHMEAREAELNRAGELETENEALREMLAANLARLTETLNELTHTRRHLEEIRERQTPEPPPAIQKELSVPDPEEPIEVDEMDETEDADKSEDADKADVTDEGQDPDTSPADEPEEPEIDSER